MVLFSSAVGDLALGSPALEPTGPRDGLVGGPQEGSHQWVLARTAAASVSVPTVSLSLLLPAPLSPQWASACCCQRLCAHSGPQPAAASASVPTVSLSLLLPAPLCPQWASATSTSAGAPPGLASRSGPLSYEDTDLFPWALVRTRSVSSSRVAFQCTNPSGLQSWILWGHLPLPDSVCEAWLRAQDFHV